LTTACKIHVLGWTKKRLPITRSKLAYEVAKKLERYLNHIAVRSFRDEPNFAVTHNRIIELYPGRIRRGLLEGWTRFHAHRQYVSGPSHVCLQGILPTGDLGHGLFDATCRYKLR